MAKINLCFLGLKHFSGPPPPPLTHSGGLIATMRVKLVSSHHEDPDGHHEGNHEGQAGDYEDHDGDHCGNCEVQGGGGR